VKSETSIRVVCFLMDMGTAIAILAAAGVIQ
jgi:hypothetical protein